MMKILDSSPLILFLDKIDEMDCLFILSTEIDELKLPKSVYKEFIDKGDNSILDELIDDGTLDIIGGISVQEEKQIRSRWPNLGMGEINVLAWAERLKKNEADFVCVLDDSNARKACELMGFPLTGSLGLLKILKINGFLSPSRIIEIVDKIKNSDFRIKDNILEDLLNV
ncbi:MAG: hypothetical protein A4E27_00402 [Methanobacterium sp. PtaU1.Bin242]|jgi:predicted nucleic acid-binding protein|nr:MAG: hypothetical protein A4E27_00402 [Methanobacterium sp. PtaU1.Bin242]